MQVRIFQPAKSTMQSGRALAGKWMLEFEPTSARTIDPLMGWTSSGDTNSQVKLTFETQEAAVAHAQKNGWMYVVEATEGSARKIKPKAYSDNFSGDRLLRWTH